MKQEEILNLVNDIIDRKFSELRDEMTNFRRYVPIDSATDLYSPITGASQKIGFFGTPKIAKQTVSGSKGANAALTSLIAALVAYGMVTDSTS